MDTNGESTAATTQYSPPAIEARETVEAVLRVRKSDVVVCC